MQTLFAKLFILALPLIIGIAVAPVSSAQNYPGKPIKLVVPYPPGGPLDAVARMLADKMKDGLGQPVIVENKPGAGGNIGADSVAKATPDGHTIVMGAVATHAINSSLFAKMPYDAVKDFAPVSMVATVPNVLVLNTAFATAQRISSVKALIAYAKANPGKLNFASGGNGSAGHLAGELFKSMARISMLHIPYNGAAPAQLGLLAGQTDLMFDNLASASQNIRTGKLKPLAVTSATRSAMLSDLPTMAEAEQFEALIQKDLKKYAALVKASGAKLD